MKRMEVLQEELEASAAKARARQGRHKAISDKWITEARKHPQLAYEDNNRCSKAWQDALNDKAKASRVEMAAKQKVERILEERKQLEGFSLYMTALPASNSA